MNLFSSYEQYLRYCALLFCSLFCSLLTLYFFAFPHWASYLDFLRLVITTTIICSPVVFTIGFTAIYLCRKTIHYLPYKNSVLYKRIFFAFFVLLLSFFMQTNIHISISHFEIDFIWSFTILLILFFNLLDRANDRFRYTRKNIPILRNKKA